MKCVKIVFKKKSIIVYLNNIIFFRQNYIENKKYTLYFLLHYLYKYGLIKIKN